MLLVLAELISSLNYSYMLIFFANIYNKTLKNCLKCTDVPILNIVSILNDKAFWKISYRTEKIP